MNLKGKISLLIVFIIIAISAASSFVVYSFYNSFINWFLDNKLSMSVNAVSELFPEVLEPETLYNYGLKSRQVKILIPGFSK